VSRSRLNIQQRGLIISIIPFAWSIAFVLLFSYNLKTIQDSLSKLGFTRELYVLTHALMLDSFRTYFTMHGNAESVRFIDRQAYLDGRAQIGSEFEVLMKLVRDKPALRKPAEELRSATFAVFDLFSKEMEEQKLGAYHWSQVDQTYFQPLCTLIQDSMASSERLLALQPIDPASVTRLLNLRYRNLQDILKAAVLVSVLTSTGLAIWYGISIRKPLLHIEKNSLLLGEQKELLTALTSLDEFGELDRYLHMVSLAINEALTKERNMIDNANDLICALDSQGRIVSANRAAADLLGLSPEELVGTNIFDYVATDDLSKADQSLLRFDTDAESDQSFLDLKLRSVHGTEIETQWSTMVNSDGALLFCVVRDVTEQRLIERLRQDFFDMVSHDLRSPLTSLLGSIELLNAGVMGPQTDELKLELQNAERNTRVLRAFVDDLLDFEKLTAGKMQLSLSMVNLADVIKDAIGLVANTAQEKRLAIECLVADCTVVVDEQKITQVLLNLITNAIKFSREDSCVKVTLEQKLDSVRVCVIDTGSGVPADYRTQIFEPFFQLPGEKRGTGLGLSICKMIVDSHHGAIGVDDAPASSDLVPASGSVFWFELPLSEISQQ